MSVPRRGRPTLRVLGEDLGVAIAQDGLDAHSPLSEIDHPIIRKAAEAFGADPADDHHDGAIKNGAIKSSRSIPLLEIGTSQWRGGVWVDQATAQPWLVAAGLAKDAASPTTRTVATLPRRPSKARACGVRNELVTT